MPITLTCDTDMNWNQNIFTVVDGVAMVTLCIHADGDAPDQGKTVSMGRHEFLDLCTAFTRLNPPKDHPETTTS